MTNHQSIPINNQINQPKRLHPLQNISHHLQTNPIIIHHPNTPIINILKQTTLNLLIFKKHRKYNNNLNPSQTLQNLNNLRTTHLIISINNMTNPNLLYPHRNIPKITIPANLNSPPGYLQTPPDVSRIR